MKKTIISLLLLFLMGITLPTAHANTVGYMYPSNTSLPAVPITAIPYVQNIDMNVARNPFDIISSITLDTNITIQPSWCYNASYTYGYPILDPSLDITGPGTFTLGANEQCQNLLVGSSSTSTPLSTILTATAVNATSINLSWTGPTIPAAYLTAGTYIFPMYYIFRSTSPIDVNSLNPADAQIPPIEGGSCVSCGSTTAYPGSYTDTGLTPGTTYYYAIMYTWYTEGWAYSSGVWSLPSIASAETPLHSTPSLALKAAANATDEISLSWSGGVSPPPAGDEGFSVFRATSVAGVENEENAADIYDGSSYTFSDTGIDLPHNEFSTSATYYYQIDENAANDGGPLLSNIVGVKIAEPPSDLKAAVVINSTKQGANLTWVNNAPGAANIVVNRYGENPDDSTDNNASGSTSTIATLPPTAASYFDDWSTPAVANSISSGKEYYDVYDTFSDGSESSSSNVASVSNCVPISGTGSKHIIFMRGSTWDGSEADFLTDANEIINNGFKSIDPFKTFFQDFSFYLDVQSINENTLSPGQPSSYTAPYLEHDSSIAPVIESQSSCGGGNFEYIFLSGDPQEYAAYAFSSTGFVFIDLTTEEEWGLNIAMGTTSPTNTSYSLGPLVIHESGHALGDLDDEYIYDPQNPEPPIDQATNAVQNTNCTASPDYYYRSDVNDLLYGSTTAIGCSYVHVAATPSLNYYAPSATSIMDWQYGNTGKFNVISCGYLIAAFEEDPVDKAHAELYWPSCMNLDTIDAKTVPAAHPDLTPTVSGISSTTLEAGDPTITGSHFSPTNNTVELTNTTNSIQVYYIAGLSSPDGTTLTFTTPASTTPGTYDLRVGAFNSPWSAAVKVMVIAATPTTTPVVPTAYGFSVAVSGGGSVSFAGTTCNSICSDSFAAGTAITAEANPESGYTFEGWSGACSGTAYTCNVAMNQAQSITATFIPMSVVTPPSTSTPAAPPVSITSFAASPAVITSGQSVTLSWTAQNASLCWGAGMEPAKTFPTTDSVIRGPLTATTVYTITCTNSNMFGVVISSASSNVTVTVTAAPSATGGNKTTPTSTSFLFSLMDMTASVWNAIVGK